MKGTWLRDVWVWLFKARMKSTYGKRVKWRLVVKVIELSDTYTI